MIVPSSSLDDLLFVYGTVRKDSRKLINPMLARDSTYVGYGRIHGERRADPHFIEPIRAVRAGEIGDLVEGRILWSNSWGPLYGWFGQRRRSGDWIVEQAVHNWDVLNWAVNAVPVRAMAMGRNDLFRDRQPDRDVHDYYTGVVEYPGNVLVNIRAGVTMDQTS